LMNDVSVIPRAGRIGLMASGPMSSIPARPRQTETVTARPQRIPLQQRELSQSKRRPIPLLTVPAKERVLAKRPK
jgi:hypothetical protein